MLVRNHYIYNLFCKLVTLVFQVFNTTDMPTDFGGSVGSLHRYTMCSAVAQNQSFYSALGMMLDIVQHTGRQESGAVFQQVRI